LGKSVTFPFGWLRGIEKENWQLLWCPSSRMFFAMGASSKKIISLGESSNWIEAKAFADRVRDNPDVYADIIRNGNL
jgi:hypothetical protein